MSERGGDDAVRVPIEIKTEDLQEIQQLIQELTEAEEEIRKAKTEEKGALPRKGRARDGESKAPYEAADMDERGGIFGGTMEEAMPQKYKDKTSKTPMQRESAWTDMQKKVQENQASIQQQGNMMQNIQGGLGQLSGGVGMAGLAGSAGGITQCVVLVPSEVIKCTMQAGTLPPSVMQAGGSGSGISKAFAPTISTIKHRRDRTRTICSI